MNTLIGSPPLSLWLPYERYRETHVAHHACENLTEPSADPESRYLTRRAGTKAAIAVWFARCGTTLFGQLTLGPFIEIFTFLAQEFTVLMRGDRRRWAIWCLHFLQTALIVMWLKFICHMSVLFYAAAFIYPGAALALLRSFAEHRAAERPGQRIAIVENASIFGLLFLNNNLHAVHHRYPGASWMQLPHLYRRHRASILSDNGGLIYHGYGEVIRRFLFRPHDALFHPSSPAPLEVQR